MKQALAIDPATTLNFYFCNIGGGLLGYATFPDMYAEDSYMHGVVCLFASLPGGSGRALQRGRHRHARGRPLPGPVPHLPGRLHRPRRLRRRHAARGFAGLRLPRSAATPAPAAALDPIHNFMDYTDDYCMDEFTRGQSTRMDQQMALYRPTMFGGTHRLPAPTAAFTRLAHQRRLPAGRAVHRPVHRRAHELELDLRRRRHLDRAESEPHLHRGRHLHRQPDRDQRRRLRHPDQATATSP